MGGGTDLEVEPMERWRGMLQCRALGLLPGSKRLFRGSGVAKSRWILNCVIDNVEVSLERGIFETRQVGKVHWCPEIVNDASTSRVVSSLPFGSTSVLMV